MDEFEFSSVSIDDQQAAFRLTSELIKKGRRNILFLGPNSGISIAEGRYQGYLDALNRSNIPINPELVVHSELYADDAYNKMKSFLNNGHIPDAVLCIGGLVAYGAGRAILESNLTMPDDLILAEFGDNEIILRLGVPFITINQNPYKIGQTAVELLVNEIENKNDKPQLKHIIVDTKLIYRDFDNTKI